MRALVIAGGGSRAAYANGVLAAFEDAGCTDFDAVYGTSAGGVLAAWFTAGQARFAYRLWPYVEDPRFLSYRRWLLGRGPLLDHERVFRDLYETEHPMDVGAVRRSRHPVVVTATDADAAKTKYADVRRGPTMQWLRATARLPIAAGPPVQIDGRRFLDGGITDPVPLRRAIEDGATDIVCVLNRPPGPHRPEPGWSSRIVARRYPSLGPAARDHHVLYDRAVALAASPPAGVTVRVVRPARDTGAGRLTRDFARLRPVLEMGEADARRFLGDGA